MKLPHTYTAEIQGIKNKKNTIIQRGEITEIFCTADAFCKFS